MRIKSTFFCLLLLIIPSIVFAELFVKQSWIAAPPPGSQVLAAYMVLENRGDRDRTLISVKSDQFDEIQIHGSMMQNGMMLMEKMPSIVIPAHGSVELSSGGLHMMLMNPARYFKAGDTIGLELGFKDQSMVKIQVPVKAR